MAAPCIRAPLATLLLASALTACGGGGDGGGTAGSGFDVQAAFSSLWTQGGTYQVQGKLVQGGAVIAESHSWQPQSGPAPGQAVLHTIRRSFAGGTPSDSTEMLGFVPSPLILMSVQTAAGTESFVSDGPLPVQAQPGTQGAFAHSVGEGATRTLRWRVEATETPGQAWACLDFLQASGGGSTQTTCLKIDAQGRWSAARVEYHSLAFEAVLQ